MFDCNMFDCIISSNLLHYVEIVDLVTLFVRIQQLALTAIFGLFHDYDI